MEMPSYKKLTYRALDVALKNELEGLGISDFRDTTFTGFEDGNFHAEDFEDVLEEMEIPAEFRVDIAIDAEREADAAIEKAWKEFEAAQLEALENTPFEGVLAWLGNEYSDSAVTPVSYHNDRRVNRRGSFLCALPTHCGGYHFATPSEEFLNETNKEVIERLIEQHNDELDENAPEYQGFAEHGALVLPLLGMPGSVKEALRHLVSSVALDEDEWSDRDYSYNMEQLEEAYPGYVDCGLYGFMSDNGECIEENFVDTDSIDALLMDYFKGVGLRVTRIAH